MITINKKEQGLNSIVNKLYDEIPDDVMSDMDESFVIGHEDYLNDKYKSLYTAKGFEDFYSMYLYGKSEYVSDGKEAHKSSEDSISKSTSKDKDTSKLQLVQRTVVRNGKPTVLSFYQDPNKQNSSSKGSSGSSKESGDSTSAGGAQGVFTGGPKFGKPLLENISLANPPEYFYTKGKYSSKLYDYIFYLSDGIQGVMGVQKITGIVYPRYLSVATKEELVPITTDLVKRLLTLCWANHEGISVPVGYADKLMDYFGIHKAKGSYTCKDLSKILGDVPWE